MSLPETERIPELDRRWRPALMAFFMRRVHDRNEAEDLTQEVFLRLLNTEAGQARSDGYVFQIAANLLIDRGRAKRVRDRYARDLGAGDRAQIELLDPHAHASGTEQLALFAAALAEVPEPSRTMFILSRFENFTAVAIAQAYNLSESAVKQRLARTIAFLLKRMRGER